MCKYVLRTEHIGINLFSKIFREKNATIYGKNAILFVVRILKCINKEPDFVFFFCYLIIPYDLVDIILK